MVQFPDPPAQIACADCGTIVWSGAELASVACAVCGNALPRTFQIAFFTSAHTEHRLANVFSEAGAWMLLKYLKDQFGHGHLSESLGISVDCALIAPEDIDRISVVSMLSKS